MPTRRHPARRATGRPGGRSRRTALLAAAALLAGVVPAATAVGAGAADGPLITLVAAAPSVTYKQFAAQGIFLNSVGFYGMTGTAGVELRTSRKSYRSPLTAELVVRRGKTRSVVPVPAGLVTGLDGFSNFATIKLINAKGAVVYHRTTTWCPSSGLAQTARVTQTGTGENPYPDVCQNFGFGFGSVVGLPAGWASAADALDEDSFKLIKVPNGTYTATITMNPRWATVLRTPAARAKASTKVVITSFTAAAGTPAARATAAQTAAAALSPQAAAAAAMPTGIYPASTPASMLGRVDGALAPATPADLRARAAAQAGVVARTVSGPGRSLSRAQALAVPAAQRPDLKSIPAYDIGLLPDPEHPRNGRQYLSFAATVWNAGPAPLVVEGYRSQLAIPGSPAQDQMAAHQFFFDTDGNETGSTDTGTMIYDPRTGHEHWHFLQFAQYDLLRADGTQAVKSQKEAFCLTPTDLVDLTVPGARYRPDAIGLAGACGVITSLALQERLDVGWGDTYGQVLPGQSIDITDLPNGTYYIRVLANPEGALLEGSTTNNESRRKVVLGGTRGKRTVTVPPYEGLNIP